MKRKCDKCDQPATFHEVEILKGQKVEKHLCDAHAAEEGIEVKQAGAPLNEVLTSFVKSHSGLRSTPELVCDACGLTFSQFREHSLLGCPHCYTAMEGPLGALLERAQEGGTHHLGKVPRRSGEGERRQEQLLRMRRRLADAVAAEDYELAARLRDEIARAESLRT